MAQARLQWNAADNTWTLLGQDGSVVRYDAGWNVIDRRGADPDRALAFAAGNYDAVAETIRYGNEFEASPYGQRLLDQERRAGRRARVISDRDYGLRRDELGLRGDEIDRRYDLEDRRFGLDERRFGLDERELDRRFGLDERETNAQIQDLERQFQLKYFNTAADYGRTARRWTDAIQFQNPEFMRTLGIGVPNPAFGAQGAQLPEMNALSNHMSGGYDPAKAIQNIVKNVNPSPGHGLSETDINAVRLIGSLYKQGAQALPEGYLESLDPDEQDYMFGVMDQLAPNGGDRFARNYGASRLPTYSNALKA